MADYVKTITNEVRFFGGKTSTKWGANQFPYTMTWGTSLWGYGFSLIIDVDKIISDTLTPTTTIIKDSQKLIEDSISPTSEVSKEPFITILNTFTVSGDLSSEKKYSGDWSYVFVSDTTEGEERDFPTWTTATSSNGSFTTSTISSTTWTTA